MGTWGGGWVSTSIKNSILEQMMNIVSFNGLHHVSSIQRIGIECLMNNWTCPRSAVPNAVAVLGH
jgi:hypothetical protein